MGSQGWASQQSCRGSCQSLLHMAKRSYKKGPATRPRATSWPDHAVTGLGQVFLCLGPKSKVRTLPNLEQPL